MHIWGQNAIAAKLAQRRRLVCDVGRNKKEKRPDGSKRFLTNCTGSFLNYLAFLAAAFLSAFFIFFAIMFSFSFVARSSLWRDRGTPAIPSLPSFYG